jgi:hypothetical protein
MHSDLALSLQPMLQRMAVSPALFFVELIGTLGNPVVPIGGLAPLGLALQTTGNQAIGFFALCGGLFRLHGFLCEWQSDVVAAPYRGQTQLAELAQPIDLIKELVPGKLRTSFYEQVELTAWIALKRFQHLSRDGLRASHSSLFRYSAATRRFSAPLSPAREVATTHSNAPVVANPIAITI